MLFEPGSAAAKQMREQSFPITLAHDEFQGMRVGMQPTAGCARAGRRGGHQAREALTPPCVSRLGVDLRKGAIPCFGCHGLSTRTPIDWTRHPTGHAGSP